jgi:hypothetical protein
MLFAIGISSPSGPHSANHEKFTAPGGGYLAANRTAGKLYSSALIPMRYNRVWTNKNPSARVTGDGFGKPLEQSCYSTISFSPDGRFPQQQQGQVRRIWQPSIMMALFIARSVPGVNTDRILRTLPCQALLLGSSPASAGTHSAIRLSEFPVPFDHESCMCIFELRFNDN